MKKCTKCKQTKPITSFSRARNLRDGVSYLCRECDKERARVRRQKLKSEGRHGDYDKTRDHTKVKARMAIVHRVESGTMKRGDCFLCGKSPTEAHHINYAFPLKVIWLCKEHHAKVHHLTDHN